MERNSPRIFPISIVEQSADLLFNERGRVKNLIYIIILTVVSACLIAANYVHIDLSVRASGVIKPRYDHSIITSTTSGYIKPHKIRSNEYVEAGDTLFTIVSDIVTADRPTLIRRQQELYAILADLECLNIEDNNVPYLQTLLYQTEYRHYISQRNEARSQYKQSYCDYLRDSTLLVKKAISDADYEKVKLEYQQSVNALMTLDTYQKYKWQSDYENYKNDLREIERQLTQIEMRNKETVIVAPSEGTVHPYFSFFDGMYVQSGQQVLEFSPNGELIAECYVTPKDIGFINEGMTGRVQVSAFNYNDWGTLNCTVLEIFDDVTLSADQTQSFYKVICKLDSETLSLKNGYIGHVRKGMTVNANFIITRRTVFQLLYDKIDNWLNPKVFNYE